MTSPSEGRHDPIALAHRNWLDQGWENAADGMEFVTSIMRTQQALLAKVNAALHPFHLTFARYEVLMLLFFSRRGSMPVGKIGARLQVHPASVTNAVAKLERARLVDRKVNPDDARGVLAEITETGRALCRDASKVLNDEVFSSLELPRPDAAAVVDRLRLLRRAFGDFD